MYNQICVHMQQSYPYMRVDVYRRDGVVGVCATCMPTHRRPEKPSRQGEMERRLHLYLSQDIHVLLLELGPIKIKKHELGPIKKKTECSPRQACGSAAMWV